ncbi:MAG: rhomboid family intramembrane serine protease, partial [Hyphomonadaceae bacterium]|nr:rhomboid family intramembrane serine protease [Hyphomonadaceae bacterium]
MTGLPEVPEERAPPGLLARMPKVVTALALLMVAIQAGMSFLVPRLQPEILDAFAVTPARFLSLAAMGRWPEALAELGGHALLHGGWLHLFFNLMILLMAGEVVAERYGRSVLGALRFLALFAASATAGALTYVGLNPESPVPMVGASGAACGLFAGYLMAARPDWRQALRDPAVLQAGAYFLVANVGLAAVARIWGVLPIAWEAHLGGFIAGAALYPAL